MTETPNLEAFFCESADWCCLISEASSYEEAAALALQKQLDLDGGAFSVGATISVVPITVYSEKRKYVYSPAVLADCGMHNHAADLIKRIDENSDPNNPSQ